jgi:hypothetical protein
MKRLTLIALSLVLITACCKDPQEGLCWNPRNPDCENYDPCFGVDSFQADFYIGSTGLNILTNEPYYAKAGDEYAGYAMAFRAKWKGPELNHTWYLGTEVIHDTSVERRFEHVPRPATIPVSYIMEGSYQRCDGSVWTGRDSITKEFYLVESENELDIHGRFKIARKGSQDSFIFSSKQIHFYDTLSASIQDPLGEQLRVINLFNRQDTFYSRFDLGRGAPITDTVPSPVTKFIPEGPYGYDHQAWFAGNGTYKPRGEMYFAGDSIVLDYQYERKKHLYYGRKLGPR